MGHLGKWKVHVLEELLVDIQPGFARRPTSDPASVPHLRTNNVSPEGRLDMSELKYVSASRDEIAKYSLLAGDVLFNNTNSDIWVGKTAFVDRDLEALYSNHLTRLRVDTARLDPQFLAFHLHTLQRDGYFKSICTRWVNQAAVNTLTLKKLVVRVPPLEVQKKTVTILNRADMLRRTRDESNKLLDKLRQSSFVKLFGDPAKNPLGLGMVKVEDVCDVIVDGTHATPHYVPQGIPCLSAKNVRSWGIDFTDVKYVTEEEYRFLTKNVEPERDDVLYSSIGAKLGIAQVVDTDRRFCIIRSITLLRPSFDKVEPKYLEAVLNSDFVFSQAMRRVKIVGVPDLFQKDIRALEIPLPPRNSQKRFVEVESRVETIHRQQLQSAAQINELYRTLLRKALNGKFEFTMKRELRVEPRPRLNSRTTSLDDFPGANLDT
jgi:type I restriction enzyme S subunit